MNNLRGIMASKVNNDITDCPICFEMVKIPKQLPCLHTICDKCLVKLCRDKKVGDKIPCPLCRDGFTIPVGGVDNIPDNELLMRLVVEEKLKKGVIEQEYCELCLETGDELEAAAYCFDCRQNLCAKCRIRHEKLKLEKVHKIVDIKDMALEADQVIMKANYCTEHKSRELELYCCEDKVIICLMCNATKHAKHTCKVLKEVADTSRLKLKTDLDNIQRLSNVQRKYIDSLDVAKERFVKMIVSAESDIQNKCEGLRQIIDECERESMLELNKIKEGRFKEIIDHKDLREFVYTASDSFLAYGRMVLERGTDYEIVKCVDDLNKRADELDKSHSEECKQPLKSKVVRVIEPSLDDSADLLKDLIGRIEYKELDMVDFITSARIDAIDDGMTDKSVRGVTVVDEEIFVVRENQLEVNAYDSDSLKKSRDINISGMKSPWGLTGCAYNRDLYISDPGIKCIHRVDLTDNSVTRWNMQENNEPRGLSVTAEHTLLVTVQLNKTEGESRVGEYTRDGQQLRWIILERSLEDAWQTVQLSTNQFIVSHGFPGSLLNRICVISAEGQIIKCFGREEGEGEDQLFWPRSLAIDENSKHIFVADCMNHRILMFDSELTCLGDVQAPHDLKFPTRLYFDSSTYRLFVAADLTGRLLVISA